MIRFAASPRQLQAPAVSLSAALAVAILWSHGVPGLVAWALPAPVALLVAWIAWQDLTDFTIPDAAVVALGCLGAVDRLSALGGLEALREVAVLTVDLVLAGGCLFLVREVYFRRRGADGLGFGDVKLAGAGGVLLGATGFATALLVASLAGIAVVLGCWWRAGAVDVGRRIAFGALLAPAVAAVWALQWWPTEGWTP